MSEYNLNAIAVFSKFIDQNTWLDEEVRCASCLQDVVKIAHSFGHYGVTLPRLNEITGYLYSHDWMWHDICNNWTDHVYVLALAMKIQRLTSSEMWMISDLNTMSGNENFKYKDFDGYELDLVRQEVELLRAESEFRSSLNSINYQIDGNE